MVTHWWSTKNMLRLCLVKHARSYNRNKSRNGWSWNRKSSLWIFVSTLRSGKSIYMKFGTGLELIQLLIEHTMTQNWDHDSISETKYIVITMIKWKRRDWTKHSLNVLPFSTYHCKHILELIMSRLVPYPDDKLVIPPSKDAVFMEKWNLLCFC